MENFENQEEFIENPQNVENVAVVENINENNQIEYNFSKAQSANIILTALRIGLYEYDKYLTNKKDEIEIIELVENELTSEIEKEAEIGAYTSYAMKFAKDLVNEPAQIATPNYIAQIAAKIAKEHKLEAKILITFN